MDKYKYILSLPQFQVTFSRPKPAHELLMVSGGRAPSADWFSKVRPNRILWCIDHGIDFCRKHNFIPAFVVGDFDSASSDSVDWAKSVNIKTERHPVDKDLTDTQIALRHASSIDNTFAIITGVFGGRFDHLFSTVFTCAHSKTKNCLIDEREAIIFLSGGETLEVNFTVKPSALSLIPISEICKRVSIDGVHWPLKSADLKQSLPNAVSNRVESQTINVSVGNGILAIYFNFGTI